MKGFSNLKRFFVNISDFKVLFSKTKFVSDYFNCHKENSQPLPPGK